MCEMKSVHQVQCITCNIDATLMLLSRVLALLNYSFLATSCIFPTNVHIKHSSNTDNVLSAVNTRQQSLRLLMSVLLPCS